MIASPSPLGATPSRAAGLLLLAITALVIIHDWVPDTRFAGLISLLVIAVIALFIRGVGTSHRVFVVVALLLTLVSAALDEGWFSDVRLGLGTAAIVAAFFSALNTLRNAASTSDAVTRSGLFLAGQPPGRRYAALTVGCQAYAVLLNYGAISLLGSLATASARREPNEEIRGHRVRRMLLAVQRGFIATLPWSPLSFCVIITTTVVPGTSWARGFWPCLVSGVIISGIGWLLDTLFKPKLSIAASPRDAAVGSWTSLLPLLGLLLVLGTMAGGLHLLTGVRVAGVVITVVPLVALGWIGWQDRHRRPLRSMGRRARTYVERDLPGYRGELTLLMMAGYIGTVGGHLLAPVLGDSGLDLTSLPSAVLLVALVWLVPLAGQIGMNPILAVSLFAPLIPEATTLGVEPTAIMVALTAGWALSGACSPFTATTLLIGSFAGVGAAHVGLRWNGLYALVTATVLSAWVVAFAFLVSPAA